MKTAMIAVAVCVAAGAACAQTSPLYVTSWSDPNTIYVFQGGVQTNAFPMVGGAGYEHAMAISDTVRAYGSFGGYVGVEYSLAGTDLGTRYTNPGFNSFYDGTTDGANYNWSTDHNGSNNLYRLDRNWGGGDVQFAVPVRSDGIRSSGVAYDLTDGTFWFSRTVGGVSDTIHMDASGAVLGSFDVGFGNGCYGVGLDPADNTLWFTEYTGGRLFQYSKTGTLLQIVSTGLSSTFGAEFSVIPAPGAAVLLGLGMIATGRRRR